MDPVFSKKYRPFLKFLWFLERRNLIPECKLSNLYLKLIGSSYSNVRFARRGTN